MSFFFNMQYTNRKALNVLLRSLTVFIFLLTLTGITSCVGIDADIVLNSDNSGTVNLEYRISRMLDSLGLLDGNEGRPPVPVGRVDFERTLDRLPGMKMVSFSSREDSKDKIITVKLQFSNIDALVGFMDAAGQKAVYSGGESKRLNFILIRGSRTSNPGLDALLEQISSGYKVNMSVNFPSEGTMTLFDSTGAQKSELTEDMEINNKGKKVTCSIPLGTVLTLGKGLSVEFRW